MRIVFLLISLLGVFQILLSQVIGKIINKKGELFEEVFVINLNFKDISIINEVGEYFLL